MSAAEKAFKIVRALDRGVTHLAFPRLLWLTLFYDLIHAAFQDDEKHFLSVLTAKDLRFLFRRVQQSPVKRFTAREVSNI